MIELRWITWKISIGFGDVALKDVLQYRQKIPQNVTQANEVGSPHERWTNWQDVPHGEEI